MLKRIMGTSSGATINDDGSIELAPMYADEFQSISRRERALKETELITLNFVQEGLAECYRDSERLWNRVGEDLGLDFKNNRYSVHNQGYEGAKLVIKPLPKEEPAAPARTEE